VIWGKRKGGVSGGGVASRDWEVRTPGKGKCCISIATEQLF